MWRALTASRGRDAVLARKRKFRLMACAFCRDAWQLLSDERSRTAVEAAEQFADRLIDEAALALAKSGAWGVLGPRREPARAEAAARLGRRPIDCGLADDAAGWVAHKDAEHAARRAEGNIRCMRVGAPDPSSIWDTCDLIRELFGNPLRPVACEPAWRTADVTALARAAYDERSMPSGRLDTARLALLADALEEAGCAEEAILSHLRGPGPHVRGCWALDLARA
jgi:hypothetical protein